MRRIPMSRAIFDTALLAWDEDLFAEPDDPDRFTTSEIDEFLELQTKSIAAEVLKMKGRYLLEPDRGAAERNQMPKGWIKSFETIPKRWRKDDPRKVFVCLHRDGYHIGRVDYLLAEPDAEPDVGSRASGIARLPNGSKPARPDISKKVQARIAELKAETMRDRLDVFQRNGTGDMLHTLLLTFACNNVHRIPHDIGAKLVLSDGEPAPVSDEDLCELATAVIARIVKFDRPDFYNASGPAAEWIARRIGVEMPRMDTDEILKGLSGDRLRALAAEHKIAGHGTLSEVRKRLAGNLPDWRPVAFGAHGPGLSDDDDEPDIGDNDAPDVDDDRIEEDAENGDDPDEEYPDNGPTDPWRTSRDDVA